LFKTNIKTLIVGHRGQDGSLLRSQLDEEGTTWLGIDRDVVDTNGVSCANFLKPIDISNPEHVHEIIRKSKPDTVYYLASHHCSSTVRIQSPGSYFGAGLAVNVHGPLNFLEAIAKYSPKSKFLYVSSSLIYAPITSLEQRITESSRISPVESYALEKAMGGYYCQKYRNNYHIFASVAIPFNHESIYRPPGFFTRDATDAIAKIRQGTMKCWEVGDLDTVVDWSYAGDVVIAMRRILKLDIPDDFIIASGVAHTTGEFIKIACDYANVAFKKVIRINSKKLSRDNNSRIGDASKLRIATGWQPTIEFSDLVKQLMQAAIDRTLEV